MFKTCTMMITAMVMLVAPMTVAQPEVTPQMKVMAVRAAKVDAYRKLAERIFGLEVTSSTKVENYVTSSDVIAGELDTLIKGARFTDTRFFSDGSAEVDAEITIQRVVTVLESARERGLVDADSDFEQITRRTERKIIKVTGSGAVRPDSFVPEPEDEVIVTAYRGSARNIDLPAIYREFPAQRRLMAKRAAELDAYRQLVERIYGLQLTATTTVRDAVTERDEIEAFAQEFLRGARATNVRYGPDGVVEVEMQVTIQSVVVMLKEVKESYIENGVLIEDTNIENVRRQTQRKIISVVGQGALDTGRPPSRSADWGVILESEVIIID